MKPEEMAKVKEILEKLDPVIHKHLTKLIANEGISVALSVITNVSTTLLATAVLIVEKHEGNLDDFMAVTLAETKAKYNFAHATDKTSKLLNKVMGVKSDTFTCNPINPTKH